ncbi:MAG: methyltransferase [Mycobacteriales bacterium]
MPSNESESSAWQLLAPVTDLVTPMAVRVAATLRLADLMAAGVERVEELAERTGADADALGRLLRHLTCHGVFAEPSPGRFTVNDTADPLRSDHPAGMRMALDLDGFGGRMDLVFTELMHTVRTGQPAWEAAFGAPFWNHLAANPAMAASYDAIMAGSERTTVATDYDWSGVRHVVDVGGGTGGLLAEVLRANAGIRGTLVDLPDTVARGRRFMAGRGLDGRCEFAGQSFFDPLPPGGDVYLLSAVLHGWADEPATAILRRCAEAAGRTGRVVLVEHATAGDDPGMFAEMDLRMLVLCGGRERGIEDYRTLVAAAGLAIADVRTTPSGQLVIDCRPAR